MKKAIAITVLAGLLGNSLAAPATDVHMHRESRRHDDLHQYPGLR